MTEATQQERTQVSRILPPKVDEGTGQNVTIRIPSKLLARVDAVVEKTGWNRTEVVNHFIRWALEELEREEAKKDPANERALEEAQRAADVAAAGAAARLKRNSR